LGRAGEPELAFQRQQRSAWIMLVTKPECELIPEADVAIEEGQIFSSSNEPWLRFADTQIFANARFVEIAFRTSLFDNPVRPVLRFVTGDRTVDRILPGPVAGAGIWRGAVPKGTRIALISPSAQRGRFDFLIEHIRPVGLLQMLMTVWRRKPKKLWSVLLPTAFGFFEEAENAVDWAINSEPLDHFSSWLATRERDIDIGGIDAPRFLWAKGPTFAIVVYAENLRPDALSRTIESLGEQVYSRFKLLVISASSAAREIIENSKDSRFSCSSPNAAIDKFLAGAEFVGVLHPGDKLRSYALACLAEAANQKTGTKLLYADEIVERRDEAQPTFKPDWSPLFESERPYLGRCAFWRVAFLERSSPLLDKGALAEAMRASVKSVAPSDVLHLRRWLMTRGDDEDIFQADQIENRASPSKQDAPSVSIILLTKDRPDLLGPCVESILRRSTHPFFELLIVDNGSRRNDTRALLKAAAADRRVRILERPEPFNFAGLNNDAVRESSGQVLVFLNDDTVVLSEDWLERLAEQAVRPDAGAVGGLLLFPDGRVQHAGVVVGLGQDAGHFGALMPEGAPCWLDRNRFARETSAVTAACMAVERHKFDAVGGFDAINLPIEFNDTDLCLRLGERGWGARYSPSVRLVHKESSTRGSAMFRPMSVYAKERKYFREKWRGVIRDDPYFHPGLSLYARQLALW
jgi:GT2 family glycosyltransferase